MEHIKTLIIGSGPAGYTAAIYAGRADLKPVLYAGLQPGGQLTTTTIVENFPGYPNGVDGNQMMMDMREQAERFGTEMRDGSITHIDFENRPYRVEDEDGKAFTTDTIIIATGATAKTRRSIRDRVYRHVPPATVSSIVSVLWLLWAVETQPARKLSIWQVSPRRCI